MSGLGIYVHWPYCAKVCPYCDFNVRRARPVDEARWARAFAVQLDRLAMDVAGPAVSLFFGGGTPSLMSPKTVAAVIEAAERRLGFVRDPEITLEANPTDAEADRFAGFRAAGVNRLSLGVQSLDDEALAFLGRNHDAAEARRAFLAARRAFDNVSIDMIYARPGQSLNQWRGELAQALSWEPQHLSLYQLTIEAGTAFGMRARRGEVLAADEDDAADLYELTQDLTEAAGLPAYEVSNHAATPFESRHNRLYWTDGDWFGLGPGAHGRVRRKDARIAIEGVRDPAQWLTLIESGGDGLASQGPLSPLEMARERVVMGLRMRDGVSTAIFDAPCAANRDAADALIEAGRLHLDGDRIAATRAGRLTLDRIAAEIAP